VELVGGTESGVMGPDKLDNGLPLKRIDQESILDDIVDSVVIFGGVYILIDTEKDKYLR